MNPYPYPRYCVIVTPKYTDEAYDTFIHAYFPTLNEAQIAAKNYQDAERPEIVLVCEVHNRSKLDYVDEIGVL
jgi:hypothetical protein